MQRKKDFSKTSESLCQELIDKISALASSTARFTDSV